MGSATCLADALVAVVATAVGAVIAAAGGKAAVTSARTATAACLDPGAAVAAAGTAAAAAAFLFINQASLLCFCFLVSESSQVVRTYCPAQTRAEDWCRRS